MGTLDRWKSVLTAVPNSIECPELRLLSGRDYEPPIFVGPGHIDIRSSTAIDFTMFAHAADGSDAFRRLTRAQENPYAVFDQFRLVATDYQGTEWACGWTRPEIKGLPKVGWPLTGILSSLVTIDSGPSVSRDSSVELAFDARLVLPMAKSMLSVSSVDRVEVQRSWRRAEHTLHILGSEIRFYYPPGEDWLWVTAKTSDKLLHPFAENWIGEPLRVLFGQLIFPRLVARNFGDGRAQVWLRPSPRRFTNSGIASLTREDPISPGAKFWDLYGSLLTVIAQARDEQGQPNFESHRITRYYEEIIQATQGSRWVLCMTLASVGEGLVKMLMRPDDRESQFTEADISGLRAAISAWHGCKELKDRVLGWFGWLGEKSAASFLRQLVNRGLLKTESERAWSELRNAVMHGTLVSPWATKEEDERLLALANLVHGLTHELIRVQGGNFVDVPRG